MDDLTIDPLSEFRRVNVQGTLHLARQAAAAGVRRFVAEHNGRDELPIAEKVRLDEEYVRRRSFWFDLRILWLTVIKVVRRDGITH